MMQALKIAALAAAVAVSGAAMAKVRASGADQANFT